MLRRLKAVGLMFLSLCMAVPFMPANPISAALQTFPYDIQQVTAGGYHSLLVSGDGTVWGWGSNDGGEVGNGSTGEEVYRPSQVLQNDGTLLSNVKSVTAGIWHSAALKNDGTVWGWGYNIYGQVGDGTTESRSRAVQVVTASNNPLTDVVKVEGVGNDTFAIKSDGTLWGWGSGDVGNMPGPSNMNPKASQIKANSGSYLTQVKDVAGGRYHVLILKEDGTVWSWGYGGYGALGNGSTQDADYPVQVKTQDGGYLTDIVDVASNEIASFALRSDGTVWSWGNNLYGNLGNGGGDSTVAVQVQDSSGSPLTGVVAIDGDIQVNVALKNDGTVWWWGLQNSGYPRATKVNLSGIVQVDAGANYGVALKNNGTLWSWGWNTDGQFAMDPYSLTYSLTPTQTYPSIGSFSVNPASISADGSSTASITVTLKDGANKPLTAGEGPVELESTLGELSQVTDNGNGTYSAVLTAGITAGTASISGKINGYPITAQGSVVLKPLVPSTQNSTITANPATLTADGSSKSTITVQLKDANGNNLTSSSGTVTLSTTAGTLGAVTDKGNGTYTAVLTAPTAVGSAVIRGKWNGADLSKTANVTFVPGAASPAKSTLTSGSSVLTADGSSKTAITVQLKDGNGNNLTSSGGTVTLNTTAGTLSSVTDHGDGSYSAQLTAPVTTGTATISGKLSGTGINQTATVVFAPGAASASKSTLTAAATSLTADGSSKSTLTVQLKDVNGNNLTASGGTVTLSTTAGTLSAVTDQGNGSYTAQLTAPTLVGQAIISGKLGGTTLTDTAAVNFVPGAPSAAKSSLTASSSALTADGSSKTTVTVQLKDINGNNLKASGGTVTLTSTAGTLSAVTDHGNGSYTAQLTAPTLVGTAQISGKLAGTSLSQTTTVTFVPGAASPAKSTLTAGAASLTADGSSKTTLTVQLKDAQGNNLASSGGTVTLSTTSGTIGPVTDHGNGSYTAQLTAPTLTGTAKVTAKLSGTSLSQTVSITFVPGEASALTSTVKAGANSMTADGSSKTTVTVQLKDANGNNLTVSGGMVTLSTTSGTIGPVTDHGNGTYTAELTAPTLSGTAAVSGSLAGSSLTQSATITFMPGDPSLEQSEITVAPSSITADGSSTGVVTVQLKDVNGNKLISSGGPVTLTSTAGNIGPVTDHGDGRYSAELAAPTQTGTAIISARLSDMALTQTAEIEFTPGAASAETSLLTLSPQQLTADGQSTSDITVQLKDAYGNNLTSSGGSLTLQADSGELSEVTDYGNGTYTAVLTAPKTVGTATVSGILNGIPLQQTAAITFVAGSAAAPASDLTVDLKSVTADGGSRVTVKVQLKDVNGNPVAGGDDHQVQIFSSLGSVSDVVYQADGTYEAAVTSTQAGEAELTASLDGIPLDDRERVAFTPGAFSAENSTITASTLSLPANGLGVSVITVELRDAFGNLTDQHPEVRAETTLGNLSGFSYKGTGTYTASLYSFQTGTALIHGFAGDVELHPELEISFGDGMFINPAQYAIDVGGKALTVVQAVYGSDTLDWTDDVHWIYDPEMLQIAKEDQQWYIYGIKPGDTVISAVYGEEPQQLTATASVTVSAVLSGLSFDAPSYELRPGSHKQVQVAGGYNDGSVKDATTLVEYHIQDPAVAEVSGDGEITGLAAGRTIITAVYGDQTASAEVKVIPAPPAGQPGTDPNTGPGSGYPGGSLNDKGEVPSVQPAFVFQIQYDDATETLNINPEEVQQGRVEIKTGQGQNSWTLQLSDSTLDQLLVKNPQLEIEWQTPAGRILLPVKAVTELQGDGQLQGKQGGMGAELPRTTAIRNKDFHGLQFRVERPAPELQAQMNNVASLSGAEMLSEPFRISAAAVKADGSVQQLDISSQITLLLSDRSGISSSQASIAVFDENIRQFRFVPAFFGEEVSGKESPESVTLKGGTIGSAYLSVLQRNVSFADLQEHWAKTDIELLANKGIIKGKTSERFVPEAAVTRAEFTAMLVRALMLSETSVTGGGAFADIRQENWYASSVQAAYEAGIVQGSGEGKFKPDEGVTRQEMAVMIRKAMEYAGASQTEQGSVTAVAWNGYPDHGDVADWAQSAVSEAVQAGIMQGDGQGRLNPKQASSRSETAAILARLLRKLHFIN